MDISCECHNQFNCNCSFNTDRKSRVAVHSTVGIEVLQKCVGCFVQREHSKTSRQLIVNIIPQAVIFLLNKMEYLYAFILPKHDTYRK